MVDGAVQQNSHETNHIIGSVTCTRSSIDSEDNASTKGAGKVAANIATLRRRICCHKTRSISMSIRAVYATGHCYYRRDDISATLKIIQRNKTRLISRSHSWRNCREKSNLQGKKRGRLRQLPTSPTGARHRVRMMPDYSRSQTHATGVSRWASYQPLTPEAEVTDPTEAALC